MKNILLAIALITIGTVANAQTSATVSQTVTLVLKNTISINMTSATGSNFTFDNTAAYEAGVTNVNAATFEVKSNRPWTVTVNTTTANFNGTASTMPASVMGVRLNNGSNFAALSTSATSLTEGGRGVGSFGVDYKATPGFAYNAGTYTLTVVYTATQQ